MGWDPSLNRFKKNIQHLSPSPPKLHPTPNIQLDEAEAGLGLPRIWPREPFTSALETLIISPARATVVRDEPDLLTAGTDPYGVCVCGRNGHWLIDWDIVCRSLSVVYA